MKTEEMLKEMLKRIADYPIPARVGWCIDPIEKRERIEEFLNNVSQSGLEYSLSHAKNRLLHWPETEEERKERTEWLLSRFNKKEESKPIGGEDEYFLFQSGSCYNRHRNFLDYGGGFTMLENLYKINGKPIITGIQVSEQGDFIRSEVERLEYFANLQANRVGDIPTMLTGKIKKCYVYPQTNKGEYAIPRIYFNKIEDAKITKLR